MARRKPKPTRPTPPPPPPPEPPTVAGLYPAVDLHPNTGLYPRG